MDIRLCTQCIIEKDGYYLQGTKLHSDELIWSRNLWDAFQTREKDRVYRIAWKTGGVVKLFNPVSGDMADLRPLFAEGTVQEA